MSVVASVSKNSVVKKEVMNKDVMEAVKEVAIDLLKSWDPASSDFIILRDFYSVSYPAPLSRELLEKIKKYSPKRVENRIEVTLPVFPYIDDATTEEVLRGIIQNLAASEEGEELE